MPGIRQASLAARSRRKGSSMVEFALAFGLFLSIIVGLIELGRGVWTYTTVAHAARQGARFAMARGSENPATDTEVRNAVRNAAVGLNRDLVDVTTSWPTGFERGSEVRVQVRYPFELVTGTLILGRSTFPIGANTRAILAN